MPAIDSKVEIEFVPGSGTYVDISNRVSSWQITRPRYSIQSGASTTTLTLWLFNDPVNGVCQFSTDNPLSPYYPHVDRDRRIRITAVWAGGASTSVRFFGWTDVWTPDAGDNPPETAVVTLTASCVLSRYARRGLLSFFGQRAQNVGTNALYYPFNEKPDADVARVMSQTLAGTTDGIVVPPQGYPGSATFNSPDGGHLTDGQIDFTRGDDNTPAPIVLLKLRSTTTWPTGPTYYAGWFKLTADPKGSFGDDMLVAYDANGEMLWTFSVKVAATLVTWTITDNTGAIKAQFPTNAPRDEGWHYWAIFPQPTTMPMFTRTKGETGQLAFGSFAFSYDPRPVQYLTVGGRMPPFRFGKQTNTFLGSISSLSIEYDAGFDIAELGNPGIVRTATVARSRITLDATPIDTLVGGALSSPLADTTPIQFATGSSNLLDRYNELARSTGGWVYTRPDGRRQFFTAVDLRLSIPVMILDAEQDLSAPDGGWVSTKDEKPTRVTVTSPPGTIETINTAVETLTGLRLEGGSIDTLAGTLDVARSVAGQIMAPGGGRISSFGVDATTTSTDRIAALMALLPTQRVRINNLATALMGVSWVDVYLNGWVETYDAEDQSLRFQFDSDPADDPPEGVVDDADYGRFALTSATVTGGSCVGTTGTGTIVITSAGGVLDNDPTQYPLELDWNGERISVSGVGGATSPQTATVTARGNAPSVARVHATGETIELHFPLTFGP